MGSVVFALGGRKSGKSRFARERARALGGDQVTFIATAQPGDPELDLRIARHRAERPARWITKEAGVDLAEVIRSVDPRHLILLDSVTLWLSWLIACDEPVVPRTAAAVDRLRAHPGPSVVVSEEAGLGVVPMDPMARRFLDELGALNQALAAVSDEVWLLVAGRAVRL